MIARSRLFTLLSELRPVTLVSAPAGYGKSVLVSTWLETHTLPYAWLTLGAAHSNPLTLARDIVSTVCTIAPEMNGELEFPAHLSTVTIADALLDRLLGVTYPMILVLDNYDLVDHDNAHMLVSMLLRRLPSTIYLILITRRDPPISLAALRAHGRLSEVRTNALRFLRPEIATFLQARLHFAFDKEFVDKAYVAALDEHTEGWGAGLQLAALYLREQPDLDTGLERLLHSSNPYALEYVTTEVLRGLSPAIQDFLIKTSILDRLSVPLCAAVIGDIGNAQTSLQVLRESNFLFDEMGTERGWCRAQHMLRHEMRMLLHNWFTRENVAELHARAGAWYAAEGMIDDALHHVLAAGDIAGGARLVAEHRHELMNREAWDTLQRWLGWFDRAVIGVDVDLSLAEAWLLLNQGRAGELASVFDRINRLLESASTATAPALMVSLRAEANVLRAETLLLSMQPQNAVDAARAAMPDLPREQQVAWSHLVFTLSAAYQMLGDRAHAYSLLEEALTWPHTYPTVFHVRVLAAQCQVQWQAADLSGMLRTVQLMMLLCEQLQLAQMHAWAAYFLGSIYYQWNELGRAEEVLLPLVEHPSVENAVVFATASCALTATYQAQGREADARAVVSAATDFLSSFNHSYLGLLRATAVELALYQGDVQQAAQWVVRQGTPHKRELAFHIVSPQLTRAKVLIALRQPAARQQAAEVLAYQRSFLAEVHNTRFLIDTLLLEAILHEAEGNRLDALPALEEALRLAQPGNLIRTFVDAGPQLLPLLDALATATVTPTFVRTIAAAIQQMKRADQEGGQRTAHTDTFGPVQPEIQPVQVTANALMVEPLTQRELEVLAALAQHFTSPEIAAELGITTHTVKHHIGNILGKLQAADRRQAVARAFELGLLIPSNNPS